MPLPHDMRDYRAPRWHDALAQYAPEGILLALLLALLLDHLGWGAHG